MSQFFSSGVQSIGASVSTSVLSFNILGRFPSELTGLISLLSKGLSRVFSSTTVQKHHIFSTQPYGPTHICMPTGKTIALTLWTSVSKVMSLILNTLSRFIIAFLPRSKRLLISRLQSPSALILEPKEIKSVMASTFSPSIYHEVMVPDAVILVFLMLSFKPAFPLSSSTLNNRLSPPHFLPIEWYRLPL